MRRFTSSTLLFLSSLCSIANALATPLRRVDAARIGLVHTAQPAAATSRHQTSILGRGCARAVRLHILPARSAVLRIPTPRASWAARNSHLDWLVRDATAPGAVGSRGR